MLQLIQYSPEKHKRVQCQDPAEILAHLQTPAPNCVSWVDVGMKDRAVVERLAQHFNLHHLLVEDIFNHNHLPKFEVFDHCCFLTLKMLSIDQDEDGAEYVRDEQIGIVLGAGWVLTFQEVEGDIFDQIRVRIEKSLGNLRKRQGDYLFYRLTDVTVDHYFVVLEHLRTRIEALEERVAVQPNLNIAPEVLDLKQQLRVLRRFMLPLKNEINRLRVEPFALIQKNTIAYFQDVYDHLNHLESAFENFREMLNDLMDLHLSYLSQNMNQVMKTLTTVSAIFIPLTFVAGIYGMNFDHMPELHHPWGYPILLGSMGLIALGLVWFMRRKGWF